MPAQTSWASEAPAVNHTASLEIEDAKSARDALDSNELCGSGFNPIQVLQSIASGFYGAAAFQKGISGALVGLLAHFFIAFAVAAIYVGATRFLPMLSREAVMWGTIYGAAVFIVMNFVVLPHTAVVKSPLSLPLLLNGVLGHALFVGLPIALAARRITNQSSLSTQAA
jgi:uncharacterized membrane protein YagU involved in acid resistance